MNAFDGYAALAPEQAVPAVEPVVRERESASAIAASAPRVESSAPPATAASAMTNAAAASGDVFAAPKVSFADRLRGHRTALRERLLGKPTPEGKRLALCMLLALLLVGQLAFILRSQLAARSPAMRTVLTRVCALAGCSVTLPQRPDLVKIEASDVHMLDPGRPALIQLTATLRSYAAYDVAYPALDLVLTNANEHALARRIFRPDEYLDQTRDAKEGIPARAEITVALDLDTGDLNAAGFRLDLLAAPAP